MTKREHDEREETVFVIRTPASSFGFRHFPNSSVAALALPELFNRSEKI